MTANTHHRFRDKAHAALMDEPLQRAMDKAGDGFIARRQTAIAALDQYEALRSRAKSIKEHTLDHLPEYLERYEAQVIASGGQVHWARDAEEARKLVIDLCRRAGAGSVAKGKSMIGEEIGLNHALEAAGMEAVETDLGEYIIQLAEEPPSHIIAPALHKTREQIIAMFREHHRSHGYTEPLETVAEIVDEARAILRDKFLKADVGITGANFLIAETGSSVIVTNEGNGDLTALLPPTHIVLASLDKLVPTPEDATTLLRLLARSATGQESTAYTSFFTGPKPRNDGHESAYHVVLIDNSRSRILHGKYRDMLRCIRCGACLNHCPVYTNVGGHAYGGVYPGPMGSVLGPLLDGLAQAPELPNASSFCGRCAEVCPMSIPLPELLRQLRNDQFEERITPLRQRCATRLWSWLNTHPRLYRALAGPAMALLSRMGRNGILPRLPGLGAWQRGREFPAPEGGSFVREWNRRRGRTRHE
ncbi:MAG: lactate utilization protein [Gammaproteobacteria bacterium]|nr:lactate utilization protein [Gammaproteobacteria bacterium]